MGQQKDPRGLPVEKALEKYCEARKALTKDPEKLPPDQIELLKGRLAGAEAELLKAVGDLINKKVTAVAK